MRHRIAGQALLIEQLIGLLTLHGGAGVGDGHFAGGGRFAEHPLHHVADVDRHAGLQIGDIRPLHRRFGHRNFDLALFQLTRAQHAAEFRARIGSGVVADEGGDQPFFRVEFRLGLHIPPTRVAQHDDAGFHQIAHDALHIAADIADFGEFGGFHLQERCLRQFGEPAGDFGFAAAGGADHQDVLGNNLFAHALRQLLPPPAVAQRNGHRLLGVGLADDEAVEFAHDFAGGKGWNVEHFISSPP